ncbi:MAG: SDR family NAD(P)-dependent oxidoreductase [Spirochaetaceae bacterium]|nr:SDR family NAD(P)-dependent oxidoreductase [Myxococcales bacterium]MCB9724569.1 SDR family NAD(P)-dependent oxidoreductase [Spirochaetaceae bacterium]
MRARRVLTTGANGAIGLATVLELARRGHHAIGTVRSQAAAETVERAARERRVDVEIHRLDVDDPDAAAALIDCVRPEVLVNNAGRALLGAIETTPEDEARALFETLVFSSLRLARLAVPSMREAGFGRIVFVGSLFGRIAMPPLGWYAAAKHALEALSDVLRVELAGAGIDVVLLEPGGVRSNMLERAHEGSRNEDGDRYAKAERLAWEWLVRTDFLRSDPIEVARVVARAIEVEHPEPRYLVGVDAKILARLAPIVPSWLSDRVTRLVQGL